MDQGVMFPEELGILGDKNKRRVGKLIQHLIGGKYRIPDTDKEVRRVAKHLLKYIVMLPRPECALLRRYYLADVTLSAGLGRKSVAVYLHNARKQLAFAMRGKPSDRLASLCVNIGEIEFPEQVDMKTLAGAIWGRPNVSSLYDIIREVKDGKVKLPMPRLSRDGHRRWIWTRRKAIKWRDYIIGRLDDGETA